MRLLNVILKISLPHSLCLAYCIGWPAKVLVQYEITNRYACYPRSTTRVLQKRMRSENILSEIKSNLRTGRID